MMDIFSDGLSGLISLSGVGHSCRARFLTHFIGATTYSSLTYGLAAGQLGALTPVGPLVPFMTGAWAGYTVGCVGVWRSARADALTAAARYPDLLAHFMRNEFEIHPPTGVPLEDWIKESTGRMTYAILAAQSCQPAVQELQDAQRQRLVEGYAEAE